MPIYKGGNRAVQAYWSDEESVPHRLSAIYRGGTLVWTPVAMQAPHLEGEPVFIDEPVSGVPLRTGLTLVNRTPETTLGWRVVGGAGTGYLDLTNHYIGRGVSLDVSTDETGRVLIALNTMAWLYLIMLSEPVSLVLTVNDPLLERRLGVVMQIN